MVEKSKTENLHAQPTTDGQPLSQWPRQKPGVACEECRRRKLRCDRRRPQCGNCHSAGVACQVTTRSPRGPKQGYLKSLQARIDALEGSVRQQAAHGSAPQATQLVTLPVAENNLVLTDEYVISPEAALLNTQTGLTGQSFLNDILHTGPSSATIPDIDFSWNIGPQSGEFASPLISPTGNFDGYFAADSAVPLKRRASIASDTHAEEVPGQPQVSRLVQADLDQFYWDRVHVFIPIVHQRRYRTWSIHPDKNEAQKCLQGTMWALAASASTGHHQNIRDSLYHSSCRAVEKLASSNPSLTRRIEYIQAWLLLAIYEFMFQDFRRGWISAGRAFRLIQLAGYEITDAPDKGEPQYQPAWAEMEERRRTLWLAYCLDRLLGMRSDTPLTFSDHVLVRLPAPEVNFFNDHPARMEFPPNVQGQTGSAADCDASSSVLATLVGVARMCGRVTSHRHQVQAAMTHETETEDLNRRLEALKTELTHNMEQFFTNQYLSHEDEPNAIFISITWHTISLHLQETASFIELSSGGDNSVEQSIGGTGVISQQAATTVQEIIRLLDEMSQLNYLKVSNSCTTLGGYLELVDMPLTWCVCKIHPLIFLPLSICTKMAESNPELANTLRLELRTISERLGCASRSSSEIGRSKSISV